MKKHYIIAVGCAIEHNNKLLIIKRPQNTHAAGWLSFPGGAVEEQDESPHFDILKNAAKREALEEVGLKLEDPLYYLTSNYFIDEYKKVPVINSVFYCKLNKTIPKIIPCEREVPEYYWMNQEEINQAPNAAEWLKEYVKLIMALRDTYGAVLNNK